MNTVKWFKYELLYPQYQQLRIREDKWSSSGWQVWPASWFLSKFFERSVELDHITLKGSRIIELGAGCALPSIVAGHLGATVIATESDDAIACTEMNVSTSRVMRDESGEYRPLTIGTKKLEWGTDIRKELPRGSFDIICGSDLFFYEESCEALLLTLLQLTGPDTSCFFSHVWRKQAEESKFFELAGEYFEIHETATEAEITAYVKEQGKNNQSELGASFRKRSSSITVDMIAPPAQPGSGDGEAVIIEFKLKDVWALNINELEKVIDSKLQTIKLREIADNNFGVDLISKFDSKSLQISQVSTLGVSQ